MEKGSLIMNDKKTKVLVIGATGMAGHVVYTYLHETGKYELHNLVYRTKLNDFSIVADVRDKARIAEVIREVQPEIIINCVGVLVKGAKEYPDNAILLNAYFPHFLKKIADEINGRLIHISTDCVFSGKRGNYAEADFKDAADVYGLSKNLGEVINDKDLTLRTSIIGPELKTEGEGLFHWFMNASGNVNGYQSAIWSGVTTLELAKAVDLAIDKQYTGLLHVCNGDSINKYELLMLFQKIWNKKDIVIHPYDGVRVDKSIQKSETVDFSVPSYEKMLEELYLWMQTHNQLYCSIYK